MRGLYGNKASCHRIEGGLRSALLLFKRLLMLGWQRLWRYLLPPDVKHSQPDPFRRKHNQGAGWKPAVPGGQHLMVWRCPPPARSGRTPPKLAFWGRWGWGFRLSWCVRRRGASSSEANSSVCPALVRRTGISSRCEEENKGRAGRARSRGGGLRWGRGVGVRALRASKLAR